MVQTPTLELGPAVELMQSRSRVGEEGASLYKDPFSANVTAIPKEPETAEPRRRTLVLGGTPKATGKALSLSPGKADEARREYFGSDENYEDYLARAATVTRDTRGDMLPGVDQAYLRIIRGLRAQYDMPDFTPPNVESAMWEIGFFTKLMGTPSSYGSQRDSP
jgi:hypothetical protein